MQHTSAEQDEWAERVGRFRRHLRAITDQWDEMLDPAGPRPGGGSGGALDDDHEVAAFETWYEAALSAAPDVPRIDIVVDVRRTTTLILNGWCRVIVEDHDVQHGIPSGADVPGMCTFLTRWADQCLEHEAARSITAEVAAACAAVSRCARPSRPEGMAIGECRTHLGDGVECGTVVRATPEAVERGEVRCRGCGTTDTVDGWLLRMVGTEGPYTAAQLIPVLHRRLGIRATPELIRQWVRRDIIRPLRNADGTPRTTSSGASLFPWVATAQALTDRGIGERRHAQASR